MSTLREFRCPTCGRVVEVFIRPDQPQGVICGPCGAHMRRVITAPAIRGETVSKS